MKNRALTRVLSLSLLAALIAASLFMNAASAQPPTPSRRPFAPGRILVKFRSGTSAAARANLHRALGGRPIGKIPGIDVEVASVAARAEEVRAAAYARSPLVAYAEPDYIAYALADPNDALFAKQWGLDNDGQTYDGQHSGTPDADIDFPEAWQTTQGGANALIAVLDSGIDQDHPDLVGKLVDNVDFTGTGIDDFYGHGTHVAGIAAAQTDNGQGVAGVGYNASVLNVKVLNDVGWGYNSWIANGIVWAADHGAQVINMSLGGYRKSRTLETAVDYAWNKGVVLAAAAGNDGTESKLYPAAYSNCIAVAATDDDDQRVDEPGWWASNYGDWVDVAAPGLYVYSTFPNHEYFIGKSLSYDYGSGTSMAAPHVAGLAGLLFGQDPSRTNAQVRALIEDTADLIPGTGTYWVHGRINACNAVGGDCGYGGPPVPGGKMHVADIAMDLAVVQRGPNLWTRATATIRIVDEGGTPVEGATVTGQWSNATGDSDSGVTAADGTVVLASDNKKNAESGAIFTFTVDDVVLAGWSYDPLANVETSDSISVD